MVIQQFLITRTISFEKELNSASEKKNNWKKKAHMESKTVIKHSLMLFWFADLMNVTEEVAIHRPLETICR